MAELQFSYPGLIYQVGAHLSHQGQKTEARHRMVQGAHTLPFLGNPRESTLHPLHSYIHQPETHCTVPGGSPAGAVGYGVRVPGAWGSFGGLCGVRGRLAAAKLFTSCPRSS